eukprot:Awhi_evm1s2601
MSMTRITTRGMATATKAAAAPKATKAAPKVAVKRNGRNVVLVEGVRTPFALSSTVFKKLQAHDLARMAISGLLQKTNVDKELIDRVVMGTVIQESRTSNIAREAALSAGIPEKAPAYTVTLACVSSNVAINDAASAIALGHADVVVA